MSNFPNRLAFAGLLIAMSLSFASAADKPAMMTRSDWQAKPALPRLIKHKPMAILIHHTATKIKPNTLLTAKMKGLQRFSQAKEKLADGRTKPAWPDVPYHFYIAADGKIAEGRDINAVGDTNTGYNPMGYIQVVLEGNFETESPSAAQLSALTSLLAWLKQDYSISTADIGSHDSVAQTACPGKHLKALLPGIIAGLK